MKYNTNLRGLYFDQLNGDIEPISANHIKVGPRQRQLDPDLVNSLKESIERKGLLQPIGVRQARPGEERSYYLVYGAHRLEAYKQKFKEADCDERRGMWQMIWAVIFPSDCSDEMAVLLELSENVDKGEISSAERKQMVSTMAKLHDKFDNRRRKRVLDENGGCPNGQGAQVPIGHFKVRPMKSFAEDSKLPINTCRNWYTAYKQTTHGKNWDKQTEPEYMDFLDWLETEAKREAKAKADMANDKKLEQRERSMKSIHEAITKYVKAFGSDGLLDKIKNMIDDS